MPRYVFEREPALSDIGAKSQRSGTRLEGAPKVDSVPTHPIECMRIMLSTLHAAA